METLRGCVSCLYYGGVRWLGETRFVDCRHPSYAGHKDVEPSRGCGLIVAKDAQGRQTSFF